MREREIVRTFLRSVVSRRSTSAAAVYVQMPTHVSHSSWKQRLSSHGTVTCVRERRNLALERLAGDKILQVTAS